MSKPLRIAFMGTPDFVVPTLRALIDSPHDVVAVYTQPPREKGRGKKLEPSPVQFFAENNNISAYHPVNFKTAADIENFKRLDLDIAVVAAYGMLLPQEILSAPKYGCINIHPSFLPRWRGPSPVQYALWQGDSETGVSVMALEKGMDTGPIITQEKHLITLETTFETLNEVLWEKGTALLLNALNDVAQTGMLQSTPQSADGVTYCKLLTKDDGRINWTQSADAIDRQVRALNPWPGTWCLDENGARLKILSVALSDKKTTEKIGTMLAGGQIVCGNGSILQLLSIQPENKKPMDVKSALNGGYLKIGSVLS